MGRHLRVAWRWVRRVGYRASRWPENVTGDNHPSFPALTWMSMLLNNLDR